MSDAYRELVIRVRGDESSIKRTEAQIRSSLSSINIPVSVDAKRAVAETRNLKQALTEAGSAAERLGIELAKGVKVTGEYILIRNAISNLLDVIADSTKQAIRFEFELAKIAQTVNKTNAQVQAYSGKIFDLSKSYGVTNIKIAETIRILTQAGLAFDDAARGAEILAKTTLLASFDDIESSTEAMIATMRTFNLTIGETEKAFEDIGVISKAYAVESADLVEAIKRAGGVFAATGGSVEELLALFTSVRQTTRESAETIATGFRTIFSRLQRPKTIQFFKELGIQLADTEGKFIGNYEAIEAINKGLAAQNIKPGSLKFAQIAEEIGGIRQISRVIPLLTKFSVAEEARQKAVSSGAESDRDAAKAKETLAFKLLELKQNFSNLLAEISQSNEFKAVANVLLTMANAATELTRALVKLGPLLSVLGASFGLRFASGVKNTIQGIPGRVFGLATGGIVPSEGNVAVKGAGTDTVPALLTPGEFVVNKASAQAYGYANLKRINRFANGGPVGEAEGVRDRIFSKITDFGLDVPNDIKLLGDSLIEAAKEIQEIGGTFHDLNDEVSALSNTVRAFLEKIKANSVEVAYNQSIQGDPNRFKSVKGLKEFATDKFGQSPEVNEKFIQALAEIRSIAPKQDPPPSPSGDVVSTYKSPYDNSRAKYGSVEQTLEEYRRKKTRLQKIPINVVGQATDLVNSVSEPSNLIPSIEESLKNFKAAQLIFAELQSEIPSLKNVKITDLDKLRREQPEHEASKTTGRGAAIRGEIFVGPGAYGGTVHHEAGHAVDKEFGEPSKTSGTFQSFMTKQFFQAVRGQELTQRSAGYANYRSKPSELFADLFARSPIDIKKILASTIDLDEGKSALKAAGYNPDDLTSLFKSLSQQYGVPDDIKNGPQQSVYRKGVYYPLNQQKSSFPGTHRNIDPQFSPGISPPTPTVTKAMIDDLINQVIAEDGGKKPPRKTRNKSGDGFKGDCCEKIVKAINNIYDLLKSGNVKVSGSAKEKPESEPVEEMVDIEKAVEQGTVKGYRVGGLAKAAFSAAAALQLASLFAKQSGDTGVVSDIGRVVESAIGPLTTAAVALGSVSELSNFLGQIKPSRFFGRETPQNVYGPFSPNFQEDREKQRRKFSVEDITSFIPIEKLVENKVVNLNRGVKRSSIPGVGSFSTVRGAPGVVRGPRIVQSNSLTSSRLFDSTFSRLGGAGTARAAGLAGGAGVLAGQLLGRGIDALRNTSGRRDIAIKEGNISEARDLAGTSQVEKDLTNLSSAVLGASFAIASVTGPAAPFVVAAGLGAAALIKSADQMAESQNKYVAGFGKAILDITKNARDFLSSQGLADSSGLIKARAAELASIENFTKIIDDNVPRLKKAIENITTRDLTKKETLEQAASGQAINDILSGFNRRRVAQLQAREARSANISRLNEAQINDESLLTSIVPRAFVPNVVASTANESQEGVLSFFGKGKAASSTRLVDENKAADEAFRKDQETSLESIRNLAEQAANRVLKSGGTLDEKTLREELIKLNKGFDESKILEGGPANKLLTEVASLANINKVFGNFNESLKEATKATLEFRSGLFDFTVSGIQGKFESATLGSVSNVQALRDRTAAFENLLPRQGALGLIAKEGLSLRERVISGSRQQAELAVATRADEQLSGEKEAELNASQLALDTAALKEQVELRKELMGSIKAEIEVEKRRVSAISDSLTALAIGSKEERKQAEKTIKVAQLLQQGADVGSLSSKQKALIPGALKFLDEDQQEKIRQRILGIGANKARALGVSGNLAGNIAQVGATGSTQTEKDLINKVQTQYEEMRKDQEALLNGQKAIAEVMNAEFNRVSLQLQETLNNNKFIDAVNMLGQIQDIKITMPENFTVDLTNVNTLMEGVTNAITAEVGRQIQSLKNGIQ